MCKTPRVCISAALEREIDIGGGEGGREEVQVIAGA